jgi:hypothetical protein
MARIIGLSIYYLQLRNILENISEFIASFSGFTACLIATPCALRETFSIDALRINALSDNKLFCFYIFLVDIKLSKRNLVA